MAKTVMLHEPGGPEVLQIVELEAGTPQEDEVRIRVLPPCLFSGNADRTD
jgi:NADPH:quinone reductase-like Zn-dependent oxidoreductase